MYIIIFNYIFGIKEIEIAYRREALIFKCILSLRFKWTIEMKTGGRGQDLVTAVSTIHQSEAQAPVPWVKPSSCLV